MSQFSSCASKAFHPTSLGLAPALVSYHACHPVVCTMPQLQACKVQEHSLSCSTPPNMQVWMAGLFMSITLFLLSRKTKQIELRALAFISSLCLNSDHHKATLILVLRIQGASIRWPGLDLLACIRQLVAVELGKEVVKEGL